jgi:hypothetical protein
MRLRRIRHVAATGVALLGACALSMVPAKPALAASGPPVPPNGWFACLDDGSTCTNTDPINFEYYDPTGGALEAVYNGLLAAGWADDPTICYTTNVEFDAGFGLSSPDEVVDTDNGTAGNGCFFSGTRDHARIWASPGDTVAYVAASMETVCSTLTKPEPKHCVVDFGGGEQKLDEDLSKHFPPSPPWSTLDGLQIWPYPAGSMTQYDGTTPSYSGAAYVDTTTYLVTDIPGYDSFSSKWQQYGGLYGMGGWPKGTAYAVTGGLEQDFSGFNVYWSAGSGTHEMHGGIRDHYIAIGGPASSPEGMPYSDEQDAPGGGRENIFQGSGCGSGSVILWSPATGAREMHGCVYNDYLNKAGLGGPAGPFGYPASDEQEAPGNNGRVNYMDGSPCSSGQAEPHSALYYNGTTWGVKGCIFQKYQSIGETASTLGYPTSLEFSTSAGTQQNFQNGNITLASGAAVVHLNCTDYGGTTMTGPNACYGFSTQHTSTWNSGHGAGLYGQEIWTYANGNVAYSTATYQLRGLNTTYAYQLQAYIPVQYANARNAHYHYCDPVNGCGDGYVNQYNYGNQWASFATICSGDGTTTIVLADDGGNPTTAIIGADAIRAVRTSNTC